jgi:hypothetical protein
MPKFKALVDNYTERQYSKAGVIREFEEQPSRHWEEVVEQIIEEPQEETGPVSEEMTVKQLKEAILVFNPGEDLRGLKKDELIEMLNCLQDTGGEKEQCDE